MGWKSTTIIINSDKDIDEKRVLNDLGFNNLVSIDKETFEVAIYPEQGQVFIGQYKGNTLICTSELPLTFLNESVSEGERILSGYYPDVEICSLVLHSVVNLWGYSVTKNGQKIRARAGSAEDGTIVEYGEPLKEEEAILAKSTIDKEGNRVYLYEEFPDEEMSEDQVGSDFVFELCKRYFGQRLDRLDDLLFETELTGFRYGNTGSNEDSQNSIAPNQPRQKKAWWRFW